VHLREPHGPVILDPASRKAKPDLGIYYVMESV
jgi:hypothetical protein